MSRIDELATWLERAGKVVVAYSGGVDSALLADVAHEVLQGDALAATAVSPSLAPRERQAARTLAEARGWNHREVLTDEHQRPGYIENSPDRCFHCKDALFDVLDVLAATDGAVVCVGTNLDDLGSHRPGLRAVEQHGVAQPLIEAGFSKADVREAARSRGLPIAEKPATPCLASRVAYGISVTPDRLARIGRAEELLWALGLSDVRVRDLGGNARIEAPASELDRIGSDTLSLVRDLGFDHVEVRELRSGSMLELITPADARNDADVG